ncbi:nucleoside triphosphate pyrophosphohydrolase [Orbaceae bacterium ac157xtp]
MQSIHQLLAIMTQLRNPINGCEWDKKQTFDSIKNYTLEETYEVLEAIEQKDFLELKNELGDLLYQIVFYCELAREQNLFTFDDVVNAIVNKLINRHPHVFGEDTTIKPNWESLKQKERNQKNQFSLLDDIPKALPALMRAEKVQKRCASVGFDWNEISPVFEKVAEELDEVKHEIFQDQPNQDKIEEEVGDLLFATVNLSRHLGLKTELTLNKAIQKFERRFKQIEQYYAKQGKTLDQVSLDDMERVWQQVKQTEYSQQP